MKRSIVKMFLCIFCALGAACSLPVRAVHDYCELSGPILLAPGEAAKLSEQTQNEILEHNRTWKKVCKK